MRQQTVSVVIAAFNASAHIERAIASVLAQSAPAHEILVVDDASTDDTVDRSLALSRRHPSVRVIRMDRNAGPGAARNEGVRAASGEWIAVLDADDAFEGDRLRVLLDLAARTGAEIVADNLMQRSTDAELDGRRVFLADRLRGEEEISAERFIRGNISVRGGSFPSYGLLKPMIRRDFLARYDLSYPPLRFAEDMILMCRCLLAGARLVVTDTPLYLYTVRPDSLTFSSTLEDLRRLVAAEQALIRSSGSVTDVATMAALRDHYASVDRACVWRSVAESAKGLRPMQVARALLSRPRLLPHIFTEGARVVAAKVGGGGLRRRPTGSACA